MSTSISRISERLLDQALSDIRQYIRKPQDWQAAMKELSGIRDYSFSDLRSCNAQTALDYCEKIKSRFPDETPAEVRTSLDAIAKSIHEIEKNEVPVALQLALNPLVILTIGVLVVLYFLYFA